MLIGNGVPHPHPPWPGLGLFWKRRQQKPSPCTQQGLTGFYLTPRPQELLNRQLGSVERADR